jgi:hypothetical protein
MKEVLGNVVEVEEEEEDKALVDMAGTGNVVDTEEKRARDNLEAGRGMVCLDMGETCTRDKPEAGREVVWR